MKTILKVYILAANILMTETIAFSTMAYGFKFDQRT